MHVVATAGHVDHGKSTLVEALTGTDPDRWPEEKERGLTIDLGFAHARLPSGAEVSFVDVPGHIRFLKNMLAGVGAVDAAVFVVAATEGWKPQSEEHLRILELLDISHGVVALTKVGLVDDDLLELARLDVDDHVAGTFLESAEVVAVDAPTGLHLDEFRAALDRLVAETPISTDRGRPRLWIDRAFAAKGSGTVVTGTLTGGPIRAGHQLQVLPTGADVRVRALQSHYRTHDELAPGNRTAVNLTGIAHQDVTRGHALVQADQWHPSSVVDASLQVLDAVTHDISRRGAYLAYFGSGEYPAQLRILGPSALSPGEAGFVRIRIPSPLPLLPGDRYILRESGRIETVGGGEVLDVDPVLPAATARPDRSIDRVVVERGWVEVDQLERLTGERRPPTVGTWVATPETVAEAVDDIRARVADAGPLGLDVASLDARERTLADTIAGLVRHAGRLRPQGAADPLADHPFVTALEAEPFAPPRADGVAAAELRELVRRGSVLEQDGVWFAPSALDQAARIVAGLLTERPQGVTVAEVRDALGTTRKHALPLLALLDAGGITRRRDDLRIAGPRLPK